MRIFSYDSTKAYQQQLYADFSSLLDAGTFASSVAFGEAVAAKVLERAARDQYKETRGMDKFLGSKEPGKWHIDAKRCGLIGIKVGVYPFENEYFGLQKVILY